MMAHDLDQLRQTLAAALPQRVEQTLAGYEAFTSGPPPADAKGFAAWHAAAKAALAHVDLLVKLARWASSAEEEDDKDGVDGLLRQARAALDALDEEEDDP
jgi:hypothetical protein